MSYLNHRITYFVCLQGIACLENPLSALGGCATYQPERPQCSRALQSYGIADCSLFIQAYGIADCSFSIQSNGIADCSFSIQSYVIADCLFILYPI